MATNLGFRLDQGFTEIEIRCIILGDREEIADGVGEYPIWTGDEDGEPIQLVAQYGDRMKAFEHATQLAEEYEVELVDS